MLEHGRSHQEPGWRLCGLALLLIVASVSVGCHSTGHSHPRGIPGKRPMHPTIPPPPDVMPRELSKVALPDYIIEPPDILLIDAVKVIPQAPYRISTGDLLTLQVTNALPDRPLSDFFEVAPGGTIYLGPPYGSVKVVGMTLDEATLALEEHLSNVLQEPVVTLNLIESAGRQQIAGEHIVGPDGKVSLGTYGKVFVAGMTQEQARRAIEVHLANYLEDPEVSVDVFGYNSKVYYVITQGAGFGDGVARFPIMGNETVLDAVSQIAGLDAVSSKRIWIARPAPHGSGCDQILPVDWYGITQRAETSTNYQLYPGDRLFIAEDKLVAMDTFIAKVTAPFERIFGFTLLGTQTVQNLKFFHRGGGVGGIGFF